MTDLNFSIIKHAIEKQFDKLSKHDLFRTEVTKDQLWETYLSSFPQGTDPIYRERSQHDCSCCRQFIKAIGNVVAIINGNIVSVWDVEVEEPAYQAVCDSMSQLVKSHKIDNVFLHREKSAGTAKNYQKLAMGIKEWEHFYVDIPWGRNQGKNYYRKAKDIATELGDVRAHHDVLLRGLTELTQDSVDTVLELIGQNSLYRGNEYKANVTAFDRMKRQFDKLPTNQAKDLYVWELLHKVPGAVSKIRNTAIGTLLIDLSDNIDLEQAVKKFEGSIMAPSNYKRPTALVSQKMVDAAKKAVEELGLTSALERRYAKLSDISVNDIIFADRQARKVMTGAFDGIANKAATPKNLDKVETVTIEKFIKDIVPQVDSIEVFFDNKYVNNLVSIIAPAHKESKPLFKWNNGFSWSYNGDFTDSIKERVKKAGGNVSGDLRCSLSWNNYDDLDLHMNEAGGFHIYYGSKISTYTGGQLDVDMNAGGRRDSRNPVENIFYPQRQRMKEGIYTLSVNQFYKKETIDVGFEVEIDYLGQTWHFAYEKALRDKETVQVAKFKYTHVSGLQITESLPESNASKTVWNIKTQDWHKVNVFMLSPNYWEDESVGNKHYLFMIDGAINDGQARGFYNEFLKPELDKHRKVIEIVAGKMKVEESKDQLSGIGFSDTKHVEVLVRVKGSFTRTLKLTI